MPTVSLRVNTTAFARSDRIEKGCGLIKALSETLNETGLLGLYSEVTNKAYTTPLEDEMTNKHIGGLPANLRQPKMTELLRQRFSPHPCMVPRGVARQLSGKPHNLILEHID